MTREPSEEQSWTELNDELMEKFWKFRKLSSRLGRCNLNRTPTVEELVRKEKSMMQAIYKDMKKYNFTDGTMVDFLCYLSLLNLLTSLASSREVYPTATDYPIGDILNYFEANYFTEHVGGISTEGLRNGIRLLGSNPKAFIRLLEHFMTSEEAQKVALHWGQLLVQLKISDTSDLKPLRK